MTEPGHEVVHTWIGEASTPLYAVLHVPAGGRARGGVVLCPPLGHEYSQTVHGLRMLAAGLADRGIAVLRVDYRGTGHSAGTADPDGWLRDVAYATEALRAAGVDRPGLVGLRAGALLAAAAAAEDTGPLVLWDPVTSGRLHLRESRALLTLATGELHDDPGREQLTGWSIPREAAARFARLRLDSSVAAGSRHVVVALRPGAAPDLRAAVAAAGGTPIDADDAEAFVSPPEFVPVPPVRTVSALVAAVDRAVGEAPSVPVRPPTRTRWTTAVDGVVEEIVRIPVPGDAAGLVAIATTPAPADEPVVGPGAEPMVEAVFFGTALQPSSGPGRAWVRLARDAARAGGRGVRVDRRSVGESPVGEPGDFPGLYTSRDREDVRAVVDALTLPAPRRLFVGLCSGGWFAARAATLSPGSRACLVGPQMWRTDPPEITAELLEGRGWDLRTGRAPGTSAAGPAAAGSPPAGSSAAGSSLAGSSRDGSPAGSSGASARADRTRAMKTALRTRMPYAAWSLLARRGLVQTPEPLLRALADARVDTTIVLPAVDRRLFDLNRGADALRRVARTGFTPRLVDLGGDHDDHDLMRLEHRDRVVDVVRGLLADSRPDASGPATCGPDTSFAGSGCSFSGSAAHRPGATGPAPLLVLFHSGQRWGAERVALDVIAEAVRRGHRVTVACPPGPLSAALPDGVHHLPTPPLGLGGATGLRTGVRAARAAGGHLRVARILRRELRSRPDTVVVVNSLMATPVARLAGVRAVWLVHDTVTTARQRAIVAAAAPGIRAAVAVSAVTARALAHTAFPVRIAPNGVDVGPLCPDRPRGRPPVVGILAALTPWKGHRQLLEAIALVPGVVVEVTGTRLPGEGGYEAGLRERASRPDLAGRVRFLGLVDPTETLCGWDVFVSCSELPEAGPLNVLEALAAGVPIAATTHAVHVDDAVAEVVPADGDPATLAGAIARVLAADPEVLRARSAEGRARVMREHDRTRTVPAMLDALLDAWRD